MIPNTSKVLYGMIEDSLPAWTSSSIFSWLLRFLHRKDDRRYACLLLTFVLRHLWFFNACRAALSLASPFLHLYHRWSYYTFNHGWFACFFFFFSARSLWAVGISSCPCIKVLVLFVSSLSSLLGSHQWLWRVWNSDSVIRSKIGTTPEGMCERNHTDALLANANEKFTEPIDARVQGQHCFQSNE